MFELNNENIMLGYELMNSYPDIFCFSTTRNGGVSTGTYASMNCTHYCGDSPEAVSRNREILLSLLPEGTRLVIPHQTHGTEVAVVDGYDGDALEGVDALVTRDRGLCLCISTADCVPVLLYDPVRSVVGAAHAGWRGTLAAIVEKTVRRMTEEYGSRPQDVHACIGPSISLLAFEVGDDVYEAFRTAGYDMKLVSMLNPTTGKHHVDLWEINRLQLIGCGVREENVELSGMCTYLNQETFFSARRLGVKSGRVLTGIVMKTKNME
jgi:hypothetical protein